MTNQEPQPNPKQSNREWTRIDAKPKVKANRRCMQIVFRLPPEFSGAFLGEYVAARDLVDKTGQPAVV
jgi:hypothetical protein